MEQKKKLSKFVSGYFIEKKKKKSSMAIQPEGGGRGVRP